MPPESEELAHHARRIDFSAKKEHTWFAVVMDGDVPRIIPATSKDDLVGQLEKVEREDDIVGIFEGKKHPFARSSKWRIE